MRLTQARFPVTGILALLLLPSRGWSCPAELRLVEIASGLSRPVWVTAIPGDDNRIFVLEKNVVATTTGRIRIIDQINAPAPQLLPTPFLVISPVSVQSDEQGLLGLAFHPNFAANGYFYVNFTDANRDTVVRRYTAIPGSDGRFTSTLSADPTSARQIIRIPQPFPNHNGGWIEFGPDGYLYIAMGDGGGAGDPGGRAQNLNELLGKMLRLDVDADDFPEDDARNYAIPPSNPFAGAIPGRDEIWAYGLRNPWRNDFDAKTGDLFIADVGQGAIEEIDFEPASSPGGVNFGWRCYEGTRPVSPGTCPMPALLSFPIYEYPRSGGACSVIGGVVYRGADIPGLSGTYFFADYCANFVRSFRYRSGSITELTTHAPGGAITSFGEDNRRRMYRVSDHGIINRYELQGVPAVGDSNGDGTLNFDDIECFVAAIIGYPNWQTCTTAVNQTVTNYLCRNDLDRDGDTDFDDIDDFVTTLVGQ